MQGQNPITLDSTARGFVSLDSTLMFLPQSRRIFYPMFDAAGIAITRQFALGIKKHNQYRAVSGLKLHHKAAASLADKARFGESYLPARIPDQMIGIMELPCVMA